MGRNDVGLTGEKPFVGAPYAVLAYAGSDFDSFPCALQRHSSRHSSHSTLNFLHSLLNT